MKHNVTKLCDLIMIILAFISLIVILLAIINLASFDYIYISQTAYNWSLPVLTSIKNYPNVKDKDNIKNTQESSENPKRKTFFVSEGKSQLNSNLEKSKRKSLSNCDPLLKHNLWPGTLTGCYCKGLVMSKLTVGKCSSNKHSSSTSNSISDIHFTYNYCKEIYPLQPEIYEKWYDSKLCTDSLDKTYFELDMIVKSNQNCPIAFKPCGIIDSLGNILCVKDINKCPISGIKVIKSSDTNKLSDLYEKIPIKVINDTESNKVLVYFRGDVSNNAQINSSEKTSRKNVQIDSKEDLEKNIRNNKIFVDFKIDEDVPCFNEFYFNSHNKNYKLSYQYSYSTCPKFPYSDNNNDANSPENYAQIPLINNFRLKLNEDKNKLESIHRENENLELDTAYEFIDSISYLTLLDSNGISQKLESLPKYDRKFSDFNVNLYGKSYIGVSAKCFREMSSGMTREILQEMSQLNIKVFREVLILVFLFIGLIYLFVTTIIHYNNSEYETVTAKQKKALNNDVESENNILIMEKLEIIYVEESDEQFQDTLSLIGCSVLVLLFYILFSTRFFVFGFDRLPLLESKDCVEIRTSLIFAEYYRVNDSITHDYYASFSLMIIILLYKIKFFLFT